jgi:hypothetical protein
MPVLHRLLPVFVHRVAIMITHIDMTTDYLPGWAFMDNGSLALTIHGPSVVAVLPTD